MYIIEYITHQKTYETSHLCITNNQMVYETARSHSLSHTLTHTLTFFRPYARTNTHPYKHAHTHTHTHKHTHIHTRIHPHSHSSKIVAFYHWKQELIFSIIIIYKAAIVNTSPKGVWTKAQSLSSTFTHPHIRPPPSTHIHPHPHILFHQKQGFI